MTTVVDARTPSMPAWALLDTPPTQGRTFQRPLGAAELGFFLDGLFNGCADSTQHFELRLPGGSQDAHLFSATNITRAWISTKRRYPLVGARVQGPSASLRPGEATSPKAGGSNSDGNSDGDTDDAKFMSEPHFVVREHDLSVLRPCEIVFGEVASAEEAQRQVAAILNGPRPLSHELLAKWYIFHEMDRPDVLHLVSVLAHCIIDRVAIDTLMRCFLDTLARGPDSEPAHIPLEDRLAMVNSLMDLVPVHLRSLSLARQRWRRAVALVILSLRFAEMRGGHTLPCRFTRSTPHIPACSGHIFTSLTHIQSATVFANCRVHKISFGSAYLALGQVAMTRVLYRRFLRGEISEEEWAYRQRQPHHIIGPMNVRPYLDREWFDRGGGGEFMLSMGILFYRLPFMTLGSMAEQQRDSEGGLSDGAPQFSDLLTFDRFLHRARLVGKQTREFLSHPLFFEIIQGMNVRMAQRAQLSALQWMKRVKTGIHGNKDKDEVLSIMDIPIVMGHRGTSLGNTDLACPSEYPLPPSHPLSPYSSRPHPFKAGYVTAPSTSLSPSVSVEAAIAPKIVVESARILLRLRPGELYLGASGSRGELSMFAQYDSNVFEEEVVKEWIDEVRQAVLWYLGRSHSQSHHAQQILGGPGGDQQAQAGYAGGGGRARL